MCILLSVKHIWCSSIPYIYGHLEGGTSALSICAFCYIQCEILFGVGWPWYMYSINFCLGSIGGGYMCPKYMCIVLYVKWIQCSGISYIYGQLEVGWYICHKYMCILLSVKLFGVAVFHTSMVNWRGIHVP